MGELPQETICAIASHLDKHELRKFSLISRAFVAESQRQLFRTVVFFHHRHFLRWSRIITPTHPIIPSSIRTLIIFFDKEFFDPSTEDKPHIRALASETFASFTKLEEIHLRNLSLCDPHQFSTLSNFSTSAQSVQSLRIEASRCSPGLMTKFIYLFPHLDNLYMEMVSVSDDEPYDLPTPSPSFQGRGRLILSGDYTSYLRFLPLRFRHLYITFHLLNSWRAPVEQSISKLNDLFITCAPTLEHLTICGPDIPNPEMEIKRAADLSPCTRLRTLRLELREIHQCHTYFIHLLASLKSIPHLEKITLGFYPPRNSFIDGLDEFSKEWDPIDTQLRRLAGLENGGLRVSLEFNGFRTRQGTPQLGSFGAFMAKYRCSSHSFTVLCDSNVVTPED